MKVEIFLKRMEDFDKINVIYEKVRFTWHRRSRRLGVVS